jgi:hypothetical protein
VTDATPPPGPASRTDITSSERVVAHDRRGRVVKGSTKDFFPDRTLFHIRSAESKITLHVRMNELKAVYFVRDLAGNPEHAKLRAFPPADPTPTVGRRIAVLFEDGELLVGHAQNYTGEKAGFFVYPCDPFGNTIRAYVLRAATKAVKIGPAAEELARSAPPAPGKSPAKTQRPPAAA